MPSKNPGPAPMTTDEVETAKGEITAYYDRRVTNDEAEVERLRQQLAEAETDLAAERRAQARWQERGEISSRDIVATDPADVDHVEVVHTLLLWTRTSTLPSSLEPGDLRVSQTASERHALLRRWLTEQGWPPIED